MHKGRAYRNHLRADRDAGLPEDDRDRLRAAVPTLRAAGERKSTRPCSHPCHVQTCSRAHYSNYRFAVSSASFPSPLLYALSSPLPPCLPHAGVSLCLCLSLSLSLWCVCVHVSLSLSACVCVLCVCALTPARGPGFARPSRRLSGSAPRRHAPCQLTAAVGIRHRDSPVTRPAAAPARVSLRLAAVGIRRRGCGCRP